MNTFVSVMSRHVAWHAKLMLVHLAAHVVMQHVRSQVMQTQAITLARPFCNNRMLVYVNSAQAHSTWHMRARLQQALLMYV